MVRAGRLVRFFPGVYGVPSADPVRAAGLYVEGRGAVSHTTALAVWNLCARPSLIHLTVPPSCRLRALGIDVHVRDSLVVGPPDIVRRDGMPVTSLDDTIACAWPLLPDGDQVAAVVRALNERMTTPARVAAAIHRTQRVADRASLVRLVGKLAAGCRSHLELFGLDHVFTGPEMAGFVRQAPVTAAGRTYYLDLFAPAERVNVELDGAAWHSSARQREADMRRDAALATRGILVVRFSYRRLVSDPAGVRNQVLAILDARR